MSLGVTFLYDAHQWYYTDHYGNSTNIDIWVAIYHDIIVCMIEQTSLKKFYSVASYDETEV